MLSSELIDEVRRMLQGICTVRLYGTRTVVGKTKTKTIFHVLLRPEWDEDSSEICAVLEKPGDGFEPDWCWTRYLTCCWDSMAWIEEWGDDLMGWMLRKGTSQFGESLLLDELRKALRDAGEAPDKVE